MYQKVEYSIHDDCVMALSDRQNPHREAKWLPRLRPLSTRSLLLRCFDHRYNPSLYHLWQGIPGMDHRGEILRDVLHAYDTVFLQTSVILVFDYVWLMYGREGNRFAKCWILWDLCTESVLAVLV